MSAATSTLDPRLRHATASRRQEQGAPTSDRARRGRGASRRRWPDPTTALVVAAKTTGKYDLPLVLLGGEAGLRRGELAALEWSDVDLARSVLNVRQTLYKGQLT